MTTRLRTQIGVTALFLQEAVLRPHQIGAILPSSRFLARAMARWIPVVPGQVVLELGPGTGAVTRAMLERGLTEEQLVVIEKSERLAELLRRKFPKLTVITGDAWDLDKLLKDLVQRVGGLVAVVSSLPLRNFSRARTLTLVNKIGSVLSVGGRWVQFSYHLHSLHPPATGCFRLVGCEIVWRNVPPARVNVYEKVAKLY